MPPSHVLGLVGKAVESTPSDRDLLTAGRDWKVVRVVWPACAKIAGEEVVLAANIKQLAGADYPLTSRQVVREIGQALLRFSY